MKGKTKAKRMAQKTSIELNFGTFFIAIIILIVLVFLLARSTNDKNKKTQEENNLQAEEIKQEEKKLYCNDVITIDIGKLSDKWEVIEKENGSIKFYLQGPKQENEDGTFNDIRINVYIEKNNMTNEELKQQMLEHSIYSNIEYTKIQEINDIQWREFEASNKGVKAKILAIMYEGYMYALEINGEENLYNQYYNEAMKTVMTVEIADKIPEEIVSETIYNYDNLANIKTGGTQYLLTSLNLPHTIEKTEENSKLPEEYSEYVWTGISYNDFKTKMETVMTEEVLKSQFSEFIDHNGILFVKETNGTQTNYMIENIQPILIKGNETTYEVSKQNMNAFITLKEKITLKYQNGKCVVSKIESM